MMATGTHQIVPLATRAIQRAQHHYLVGQRVEERARPGRPLRRATQPSMPSVKDSTPQMTMVDQLAPHKMIRAMSSGVARSRRTVMPLAGVINADGPNV